MNYIFSRTKIFIFCFLFIYFIQIVVGPPKHDPAEPSSSSFSVFLSPRHNECFKNIHTHFQINIENRDNRHQYFQNAILYLRNVKDQEEEVYINGLEPGQSPSPFLLYDGKNGCFITDEFTFKYYKHIENKYTDLVTNEEEDDMILAPSAWCNRRRNCLRVLNLFGFVGRNLEKIFKHAFSNIVLSDIESRTDFPHDMQQNEINYAIDYMNDIISSMERGGDFIEWPEKFCINP